MSPTAVPEGWIDVHSHVVPDLEVPASLGTDRRWPTLVRRGDVGDVVVAGRTFRTVDRSAWDVPHRLAQLDAHGIAHQVVSPMPELFSYWASADDAVVWCDAVNDRVADTVAAAPTRLTGLGIVPLQSPGHARAALARVADRGLAGVELGTNVNGESIGAEPFRPVFEEAERLGLLVFVHAFHPPYFGDVTPSQAANAVTFPPEVAAATGALIANGIVQSLDRARLLVSHGGGGICQTIGRLGHFWERNEQLAARLHTSPLEQLRQVWFDSLVFGADALQALVDVVGEDQVVAGTDHPFFPVDLGCCPPSSNLERWRATTRRNASRLLGWEPAVTP